MPSTELAPATEDEAATIAALRRGDEKAFGALVDAYRPMVLRVGSAAGPSPTVAEARGGPARGRDERRDRRRHQGATGGSAGCDLPAGCRGVVRRGGLRGARRERRQPARAAPPGADEGARRSRALLRCRRADPP